jgi:hypothetical protein
MTLEQIREGLVTLIDANDTVENNVVHASPEMRKAQRIGNALRNAVNALKDCDDWSSVPPPKSWPVVDGTPMFMARRPLPPMRVPWPRHASPTQ